MGDVAVLFNCLQRRSSGVARVSALMFLSSDSRTGTLNHDGLEHCAYLPMSTLRRCVCGQTATSEVYEIVNLQSESGDDLPTPSVLSKVLLD